MINELILATAVFAATDGNGLSEDVARMALGGQLAGRILGTVIFAYLFISFLWLVYKLLQAAVFLFSKGKCRLKNLQYKVPWWFMLLLFAGNFSSFREGWQETPGLMYFGIIVCLTIVFALWRKQRQGKREAIQTGFEATRSTGGNGNV